jgi:hypothetical protein
VEEGYGRRNGDGELFCDGCYRPTGSELTADDDVISHRDLVLPSIPGREQIRNCGVEIEGARGTRDGGTLARAFYEAGLSNLERMGSYHTGTGGGFAHVENDSSVDWEAVIGPVNMASASAVRSLNQAVRLIRDHVHDGDLKLDLRCGLHIHVGAEAVSMDAALNLNKLFGYIEDVVFRLAAARWPMHRSCSGNDYAVPVPKDLTTKAAFGRTMESNRYSAVNFSNYLSSMLSNCRCGAVRYDDWANCTCTSLGKCTFEFRVFNSTANPRKLHAYLALCQALVAKAISSPPIDVDNDFPALTFNPRVFSEMTPSTQASLKEEWEERLRWIFTELPLTDSEKQSLYYCVVNSELNALGDDVLSTLIPTTEEVAA